MWQSCEKIRLSLESCEVEKDITSFIQERGTGQEIPDPPKYINFCRGDLNDTASEASEDDAYSVAQFQRTINPAFRSSSPQPSTYESHHEPKSDFAVRLGHQDLHTPPSREATMTPQKSAQHPPPPLDYRRQAQEQAKYQHDLQDELPTVPHNEYPTDGMTMFCRTGPPSEPSSAASPARPSSRDSHSDYSNPTSFSSIEPASGKQSPVKPSAGAAVPVFSPEKQIGKKRSGFFSNSPFRRKSKQEKDGREQQQTPMIAAPTTHNTWGPSSGRTGGTAQPRPTRGYGQGNQTSVFGSDHRSGSPEPVDPRANFQLNVGNNVFDVASPDGRSKTDPAASARSYQEELDPIAQALAELKGVTKQSSVRMSADRYHGLATPAPGAGPSVSNNNAFSAAQRGTPPPSYNEQAKVKRLDLPQPAFTSAQMQQTARKYVGQNQDMYGSGSRPGTRGSGQHDMPRATSPAAPRSVSPRPAIYAAPSGHSARSVSPNPYATTGAMRPRQTQSAIPTKHSYGSNSYSSQHASPNDIRRAASPQPQYSARPSSSGAMALQLAPGQGVPDDIYGGSQRGRGVTGGQRPTSYYGGAGTVAAASGVGGGAQDGRAEARVRSKSVADGRQFTRDGRPILHFGKCAILQRMVRGLIEWSRIARALYMYHAAIPEELSFAKGDVLAVLRLQDDGWWEAEVTGKKGRPGLVPSNYLQQF